MRRAPSFLRRLAVVSVALHGALLPLLVAPAGADKPKLHLERVDTDKYPLIKTWITFVEGDGRVITGKGREDFKLIFDSNEQGVAADAKPLDQVGEPIFLVIVAQVSGVMHEVFNDAKQGARQLGDAASALKGSKVGLLAYAQETKRLAEMVKPEELATAAAGMAEDTEGTEVHLLDAVRTAMDLLNSKAVPDKGRKVIVVFSDGIDVAGADRKAYADLGKRAAQSDIVIDTIGYAPFEATKLKNLAELSKQTNGTDRVCKSAQEVVSQFSNTADEIRKQYIVLFNSVIKGDGKEHTIQVVNETMGSPVYSNNINKLCIDSGAGTAAPADTGPKKPWALIVGGAVAGLLVVAGIIVLVRRRRNAPVEEYEPVAAAPAPSSPGEPMRTMAMDISALHAKGPVLGWFVGINGAYADRTFRLKPSRTVIGTASDADVQIEDPKVSRRHCEIRFDGTTFKIVDLGSTNGVVLNDSRVPQADLIDGDLFRLGGTEFKFKSIG